MALRFYGCIKSIQVVVFQQGDNIGITSSTCRHCTLSNSIICSDSYPIPILSLLFMLVMGLYLPQIFCYMQKYPLYYIMGVHCFCLHVNYTVYKHFDRTACWVIGPNLCTNFLQFLRYWDSN